MKRPKHLEENNNMEQQKDQSDYYERYVGLIYYQIIKTFGINKIDNVIEFAPGFKLKVAYALSRLNFKGNLYIIDSNSNVLEYVLKKYQEILPEATIIPINKDINQSIDYLPKKANLFLANHSIDDMIISRCLDRDELKKAFDNTDESKEILINCWNELKNDNKKLLSIEKGVLNELKTFFNKIDFDLIIMSQYKSAFYMEQKNYIEELSKKIFDELKTKINIDIDNLKKALDFEFEDFSFALKEGFSLKQNVQYYDNWIAGKYIK